MEDTKNTITFVYFLFSLFLLAGASNHRHRNLIVSRPTKLFVFGDSYSDTGNNNVTIPYGVTFPGKPAGRFSDGRVLTDYVAKFVGVKSPVAYTWWKNHRSSGDPYLQSGMNFAFGGSGVFQTLSADYPNMTSQIGFLKDLIADSVFNQTDLHSSVALVTAAGNDYNTYLHLNGSPQGWLPFIASVVNQLKVNLRVIRGLGVKKIAVGGLQPLGCLPPFTTSTSNKKCNDTINILVDAHNFLLKLAVDSLNNENETSSFFIIDLYASFSTFLNTTAGGSKFETPLKECCAGTCGSVDANGVKQYTVCEKPDSSFFWDAFHPTQAAWSAVYPTIQNVLQQLLH